MRKFVKQVVAFVLAIVFLTGCGKSYPSTAKERTLTDQLIDVVMENMSTMDQAYAAYQEGISLFRSYADGKLEGDAWFDQLDTIYARLESCAGTAISVDLLYACQDSPYSGAELNVLPDFVTMSGADNLDRLMFLEEFVAMNAPEEQLYCKLMLDNYSETAREEWLNFWYSSSEFFLPITDKAVLDSFIDQVQVLSSFQGIPVDMPASKEEAQRLQDVHYQRIKELVDNQALLTGQMVQDLQTQQEDLEAMLQQKLGLSQEEARELVDELLRAASREQLAAATAQE